MWYYIILARIQQKYFSAWHLGSGMKAKDEGKESDPILGGGEGEDEKVLYSRVEISPYGCL